MKKLFLTCDAPSWLCILEIKNELLLFEKVLLSKYSELPFDFCVVFRCLSDFYTKWKSKGRFDKKSNVLFVEVVMFSSEFEPVKKNKTAQRKIMGNLLFPLFKEVLTKYQKRFPALAKYKDELQLDFENWLIANKWYGNVPDQSVYSLKQITRMFVEVREICEKDVFDNCPVKEAAIPKLEELRNVVSIYLLDQPNDIEALRIMCFIHCYLMDYTIAYQHLENAVILSNDSKDKVKLTQLARLAKEDALKATEKEAGISSDSAAAVKNNPCL